MSLAGNEWTHEYKSRLETFLSWDDWMRSTRTPEEYNIYLQVHDYDNMSDEKIALYNHWLADQQIIEHITYENGVEISRETFHIA